MKLSPRRSNSANTSSVAPWVSVVCSAIGSWVCKIASRVWIASRSATETTFVPYWLYWSLTQLTRFSAPRRKPNSRAISGRWIGSADPGEGTRGHRALTECAKAAADHAVMAFRREYHAGYDGVPHKVVQ